MPKATPSTRNGFPGPFEPFGGSFLVRGGHCDTLEGGGQRARILVLTFPSLEEARDGGFRDLRGAEGRAPAHDLRPHSCGGRGVAEGEAPCRVAGAAGAVLACRRTTPPLPCARARSDACTSSSSAWPPSPSPP